MGVLALDRLDRYALRLLAGPMGMALAALLLAQLLERLLRLFDLAASARAAPSSVLWMAANLVPHYLGLALPMAFTAAIFAAAARLSDDNELDVMLASGRPISRLVAPYFLVGLLLSLFSVYLLGYLQPLARNGYHVAVYRVLQTPWDARVEENRFIKVGPGRIFSADAVEADGRGLRGVFIERRGPDGEEVLTAARGRLERAPDGRHRILSLEEGLIVREQQEAAASSPTLSITRFAQGTIDQDVSRESSAMPVRGDGVSERTLPELWGEMQPGARKGESAAEFHNRLARALIYPFLPLLALPLGIASKRGRRTPGIVFATLALLTLDHALQFGESLAKIGRVPAAAAAWTPFAVFALLSLWIFRSSLAWPGDNPVSRAVIATEGLLERALPRRRRPAGAAAGDAPGRLR
jgi:lipopolysaccharide export system permease protein